VIFMDRGGSNPLGRTEKTRNVALLSYTRMGAAVSYLASPMWPPLLLDCPRSLWGAQTRSGSCCHAVFVNKSAKSIPPTDAS
jgi:hypothetical protein